jgi:hypothetical protein
MRFVRIVLGMANRSLNCSGFSIPLASIVSAMLNVHFENGEAESHSL